MQCGAREGDIGFGVCKLYLAEACYHAAVEEQACAYASQPGTFGSLVFACSPFDKTLTWESMEGGRAQKAIR